MNLKSKIAIVTGASQGIGAEFSKMLIENGSTVYGLARSKSRLKEVKELLGEKFVPIPMDITDLNALETWVEKTFTKKHRPDILVNNAGVGYFAGVDELAVEQWHQMVDVNLTGIFNITRLIAPLMKEHKAVCHIVNIASIAGLVGNANMSGYNATKFGVRGFSEALFKELRYDGIKVTCIYPGSIATDFFDSIDAVELHPNMMQARDVAQTLKYVLETPDNFLVSDITMRPLNPKPPKE